MNNLQNYSMDNMVKGWTRVDMLIALYDRTISAIELAQQAKGQGDNAQMAAHLIQVNRFILALHSGLDIDNSELAGNIARLLNFVAYRLEQQNFGEAIRFLTKLQATFEEIREEATKLEKDGKIPPLMSTAGLNTVA